MIAMICALRLPFLLTLIVLVALTGCGAPRPFTADHAELVAWWIEDVVRGAPRDPDELRLTDPTTASERVATWAAGSTVRGESLPPPQMVARRARWPALRALFRQGMIVETDDALVAARPDLARDDQDYVLPVIDAENHDRRAIEAVVAALAQLTNDDLAAWVANARKARLTQDIEAGAKRWVGKR